MKMKSLITAIVISPLLFNPVFASSPEPEEFGHRQNSDLRRLERRLQRQIDEQADRIEQLEKEVRRLKRNKPNEIKGPVWVCKIDPPFDNQRFIATSPSKSVAQFEVADKCLQGGVDKFYCQERNAKCHHENTK